MSDIKRVKASDIELTDKLVGIQRVTKVTKGGRTFSFSAIVVVGDGCETTEIKCASSQNNNNTILHKICRVS